MHNLLDYDQDGLRTLLKELGHQPYRGDQVRNWIYRQGVDSFDDMTNLSLELRQDLAQHCTLGTLTEVTRQESSTGDALKLLLETHDGHRIETVLLREGNRRTACISSQVGCSLGCTFCASTVGGCERDLSRSEILEQALHVFRIDGRLTNVVVMGMGEPMLNLDEVIPALHQVHAPWALNVGARRTTVSTAGVVPGIDRLAEEAMQWKLAISLHAAEQSLRETLMPVSTRWPINEVVAAARRYARATSTLVTWEYILVDGVNDSTAAAHALGRLLKNEPAKVNLIPMNPTTHTDYRPSPPDMVKRFTEGVRRFGIVATVRVERGRDIDAACGQLKRRGLDEQKTKRVND